MTPPRVASLLVHRARLHPDGIAFIEASTGERLTWRELALHAERWKRLAAARGLRPGHRAGLVVDAPLAFAGAYLSALAAGMTVVPLDPRAPLADLTRALARMRVDVVVSDRADVLEPSTPLETWCAAHDGPMARDGMASHNRPSDAAIVRPAVLLSSSGTTGAPKGIPLDETLLLDAAARIVRHHRLRSADRGYTPLPLFHVNAQVVGLLSTLLSGGSLAIDRRFQREEFWDRVAAVAPTWLNTVPAVLSSLLDVAPPSAATTARLRFARTASAPLPLLVHRRFEEHTGVGLLETYGMTEAASQITANPLDPAARRLGSVGLPCGVEVAVFDGDGQRASTGEIGVVHLRGDGVVGSYVDIGDDGVESLRSARDGQGWLCTGDAGAFDGDGFLHLAGRVDDVINRGGEKFYPAEIESVLLGHAGVAAATVVAAPHPRLGQVPSAFVIPTAHATAALAGELQALCAAALPRYKCPAVIRVVVSLPIGATGKVRRRELVAELVAA